MLITTGKGELLVTVNDSVGTELSYTTPLKRESDLIATVDFVIKTMARRKLPQCAMLWARPHWIVSEPRTFTLSPMQITPSLFS